MRIVIWSKVLARSGARAVCAGLLLAASLLPSNSAGQSNVHYEIDARFDASETVLSSTVTVSFSDNDVLDNKLRLALPFPNAVMIGAVAGSDGRSLPYNESSEREILTIDTSGVRQVTIQYFIQLQAEPEPYGYYMFSDPTGDRWYPRVVKADGESDHFSDFVVTLDFPDDFGVLTTGGYGERDTSSGRVLARYSAERVQDFAVVGGQGFTVTRYEDSSVPVFAFSQPEYRDKFAAVAAHTSEALEWYTGTYGFFPLSFMGVIQGHPRWGGGFPLSNMFMVHLGYLEDDFLAYITAHELGHYYWGLHVVGHRDYLDWLVLANGIWADQLFLAQRSGRSLEEQWRRSGNGNWFFDFMSAVVANREQRLDLTHEDEAEAGLDFDYNTFIRHGKAATGLFLQSRLVGEQIFLQMQRDILKQYRHRPLPVDDFIEILNGVSPHDTRPFFDAWRRGDARIEATVDKVEVLEDGRGFRVAVKRTGNVPYPIDFEIDLEGGESVRHRLAAESAADTVFSEVRPLAVRFDPDGVVPMAESSHPRIRSIWLKALYNEGLNETFIPLAQAHLVSSPDDHDVRYRLARRLYWLGRWEECAALWTAGNNCTQRSQCLAGIFAARSLGRLGREAEAKSALEALQSGAREHDAESFWETVSSEVAGEE